MTAASAGRTTQASARPPSRILTLAEPGRAMGELASFYALRPFLRLLPHGDGHGVLVLPGFLASDRSTVPLRSVLADLGYRAAGWRLGRNMTVDNARIDAMAGCVEDLFEESAGKISIVGWSLGGVFARELAKLMPEKIRQVISLGSPISDDRNHTNARRLFEYLNGREPEPMQGGRFRQLSVAPPVPTTSIYTRTDGIVHWRGSIQADDHDQCENIEVRASHCGLGVNPSAVYAIADRLAQAEGEWTKFKPRGLAWLAFPQRPLH